ncbi:MAG: hypothetical protein RIQ81_758 [Pseudomonadota bacterium]|jgi:uncharacterized membrane protein YgdD (TMEM256/DUF423 family)
MLWTTWIAFGALMGMIGVAAGAFGAHALKGRVDADLLVVFETGARYQMYHALALIGLGLMASRIDHAMLQVGGFSMLLGTLVFSGSLYALVMTGNRALGAVTPIGGAALIFGWLMVCVVALKASFGQS